MKALPDLISPGHRRHDLSSPLVSIHEICHQVLGLNEGPRDVTMFAGRDLPRFRQYLGV